MTPKWRKSSRSGTGQSNCVELAALEGDQVGVRDSKSPDAGHQAYSRQDLKALFDRIKAGELDLR
ncbi:MAG: DUF397 domain-containing protein [Actinomadura rubrobrunea]|nr:DUF397 domain-containing protein [Actinomadura rubrobrunea]